jgi:Putative Zn-dependent protease, contains TPR repeats
MHTVKQRSPSVFVLVMSVALVSLVGCETNPYTGRSQLLMTSVSQEMQMGAQAYDQVKSDPKMRQSQDPREIEPVKRVAARIIEAAKRSKYAEIAQEFQWEVTIIKDDKTMNAFALPGGKIAVYTGIFPVARTKQDWLRCWDMKSSTLLRVMARTDESGPADECGIAGAGAAAGAAGGGGMLSKPRWQPSVRARR